MDFIYTGSDQAISLPSFVVASGRLLAILLLLRQRCYLKWLYLRRRTDAAAFVAPAALASHRRRCRRRRRPLSKALATRPPLPPPSWPRALLLFAARLQQVYVYRQQARTTHTPRSYNNNNCSFFMRSGRGGLAVAVPPIDLASPILLGRQDSVGCWRWLR